MTDDDDHAEPPHLGTRAEAGLAPVAGRPGGAADRSALRRCPELATGPDGADPTGGDGDGSGWSSSWWWWPWRWPPDRTSTTTPCSPAPPSRCNSSSPCPPDKSHPVTHPVLLTDVEIGRVTALSYLFYKLQSDTDLEPVEAVTGGTPPSQLDAQGTLEMSQAEADAKTAALSRLGYTVTATPAGAVIFGTFPGTPAYAVLHVGDVVTAVDGVATPTAAALTTRAVPLPLGADRDAHRAQGRKRRSGPGAGHPQEHRGRLGRRPDGTLDLGIEPEDQVDFTYPFPVNIDVTNIGGPSAGLAMTLGVIDALTNGSVTGGTPWPPPAPSTARGTWATWAGCRRRRWRWRMPAPSIFLVPPQEYKAAHVQGSARTAGSTQYPRWTRLGRPGCPRGAVPPVRPGPPDAPGRAAG